MKKYAIALAIIAIMLSVSSCSTSEIVKISPDYIPYGEVPADYTLGQAKADGCVVFEDGDITSGQELWDDFVRLSDDGMPCVIRLVNYYTLEGQGNMSAELYEQEKDKYPQMYWADLTFEKSKYKWYTVENGVEYNREFKYMKYMEDTFENPSSDHAGAEYFYLVDDRSVTHDDIMRSMFSSSSLDGIANCRVYSKYYPREAEWRIITKNNVIIC